MSGKKTRKLDTIAKLLQAMKSITTRWQDYRVLTKVRTPRRL